MIDFLVLLLMQVTIFSSITALIIIAIKQIFKCRIPPRIGMIMWIILLARLICPIFPESRVSIYNLFPVGREIMYSLTNDIADEIDLKNEEKAQSENPYVVVSRSPEENSESQSTAKSGNAPDTPLTIGEYIVNEVGEDADNKADILNISLLIVYIGGISVSVGLNAYIYRKAKRKALSESELCTDERLLSVYYDTACKIGIKASLIPPLRCGRTSMLVGCISPVVICRGDMDEKEAAIVFAHELSHYKYGDNPILMISTFGTCLFWYNPLIWIVRKMLREDVEVLCDSRTIGYFNISSSVYALMICKYSIPSDVPAEAGCHMSASGRSLKNRLRTISHNKNKKFLPKIASGLLCVVVIAVCLTNPIISQNSDYSEYIENFAAVSGVDERYLYLSSNTTVSLYLNNLCTLLEKKCAPEYRVKIGNGSLEKFKRIVSGLDYIDDSVASEVQRLITDEILTEKSCALINNCVVSILTEGNHTEDKLAVLPEYITVEDMNAVLSNLTKAEGDAVLTWYNKGVNGAEVEFDKYYTKAMMELITSRINDEWSRIKLNGFYSEITYDVIITGYYSSDLEEVSKLIKDKSSLYVLDPNITSVEEATLRQIIGAAVAGEREDVYYLKDCEDGCSAEIAELLFLRGGYDAESMLDGYAEVGETAYKYLSTDNLNVMSGVEIANIEKRLSQSVEQYFEPVYNEDGTYAGYSNVVNTDELVNVFAALNKVVFVEVREGEPEIDGIVTEGVRNSIYSVYKYGLIDAENNIVNPTDKVTSGQSIYYAYKLVASMTNLY